VWVSDTGRPALVFEPAVEVEPAYRLLLACGAAMHDRDGIATWLQLPPERVEQRVADGELFAAGPLETPVAVFALSPTAPAFYDLSLFRGDEPAHYLSLVAVDPRAGGRVWDVPVSTPRRPRRPLMARVLCGSTPRERTGARRHSSRRSATSSARPR
jgi:hypothetical protein